MNKRTALWLSIGRAFMGLTAVIFTFVGSVLTSTAKALLLTALGSAEGSGYSRSIKRRKSKTKSRHPAFSAGCFLYARKDGK